MSKLVTFLLGTPITLTVMDVNGNTATCDATVTIQPIDIEFIRE